MKYRKTTAVLTRVLLGAMLLTTVCTSSFSCGETKTTSTETEAVTEQATQRETQTERVTDSETETESETQAETESATEVQTEPVTEPQTEPEVPFDDDEHLTLYRNGKSVSTIIRSVTATPCAITAVNALRSAFKDALGSTLPMTTDDEEVDAGRIRISVGRTSDPLAVSLLRELGAYEFAIGMTDDTVAIVAADDALLGDAVEYFIQNYMTADCLVCETKKNMKIVKGISYRSDGSDRALAEILPLADTLTSVATPIFYVPTPDANLITVQGGCTDGTYHYAVMMKGMSDQNNNPVYVVKTDLMTGKVVATSECLALCHGNDMTYNSKTGELIVALTTPQRDKLAILDPDTLALKEIITIPYEIYSISYEPTRDKYVVGLKGSEKFRILNSDFSSDSVKFAHTDRVSEYTSQGCGADENFIYFQYFEENCITVYDWNGDFVTLIELPDIPAGAEPEHVFVANGTLYVGVGMYQVATTCCVYIVTPILPQD